MNKKNETQDNRVKLHVKKGDKVIVISGKSKGKTGRVLEVLREKRQVIVEGVNLIKRHQRPTQKISKGGIIEREGPIRIDKIMLVDPRTGERTRIGRERVAGKTVRVARKSGEMIDQA